MVNNSASTCKHFHEILFDQMIDFCKCFFYKTFPLYITHLDSVRVHEFSKSVDVLDILVSQLHPVSPVERANVVLYSCHQLIPVMLHCTMEGERSHHHQKLKDSRVSEHKEETHHEINTISQKCTSSSSELSLQCTVVFTYTYRPHYSCIPSRTTNDK